LKNQAPEKTIYIDGVDYVDIYRLTPPAEGSS
jgi:hypothetical protein